MLADPPAAPTEQQPVPGASGGPAPGRPRLPAPQRAAAPNAARPWPAGRTGACNAAAGPDKALSARPGWRTGAAILGALAMLVVGAAMAAYAALSKGGPSRVDGARGQSPRATTRRPTTPVTPATPRSAATAKVGTPTTVKPALPLGAVKPPKIPLRRPTPKVTSAISPPKHHGRFATTPAHHDPETNNGETRRRRLGGSQSAPRKRPDPARHERGGHVYNPYNYPATLFGDPSLAIDGDNSTGWTALVDPSVAPRMAEGLLLDLKTPQKLGSVAVKTTTTGVTVEVYGTNGHSPPASISAPEWKRLVGLKVLKKKNTTLALKANGKGYRYIVLWLAKAPASSTAAAPGAIAIDEFELFPPQEASQARGTAWPSEVLWPPLLRLAGRALPPAPPRRLGAARVASCPHLVEEVRDLLGQPLGLQAQLDERVGFEQARRWAAPRRACRRRRRGAPGRGGGRARAPAS